MLCDAWHDALPARSAIGCGLILFPLCPCSYTNRPKSDRNTATDERRLMPFSFRQLAREHDEFAERDAEVARLASACRGLLG